MLFGGATCPARHALDLSGLHPGSKFKVLLHYTSKLGAANITNESAKQADGGLLLSDSQFDFIIMRI